MTNPILDALILYSGAGFVFYRAWVLHDFSKCLPACLLLIFAFAAWPFFVPMVMCLSTAYIAALIFLPFLKAKGLLKKRRVIWIYSLLAFLGLVYGYFVLFVLK